MTNTLITKHINLYPEPHQTTFTSSFQNKETSTYYYNVKQQMPSATLQMGFRHKQGCVVMAVHKKCLGPAVSPSLLQAAMWLHLGCSHRLLAVVCIEML